MFYLDLFRCLHERRVRYLLVGGLAMNLHGVPRMTMDVDLVLAMDNANLDAFLACAQSLGLKPQAPVPIEALKDPEQRREWVETKNVIAFALGAPDASGATVDILLRHALNLDAAMAAASMRDVGGVPIRLCSVEDMIALKQGTGRRQDAADVEHLHRIREIERNG
jgi:hypothetical protein